MSQRKYRLGDIIITNAKSIGKDYPYSTIQYLDTGSITCNQISDLQVININDAPSRAKRLVNNEDIVYSLVRPNQQHFGYIDNAPANIVVSTGFVTITCNGDIIYPKYLYYFLTQKHITEYLQAIAETSTSAYPAIKPSDIEDLQIVLPSLEEQKRIAGILGALDDKIELNRRINANLELQAQTLFKQWFIDFEFPNSDGKPYKSSGGKFIDSPLGPIPIDWKVGDIYEYIDVIYGAPYKSSLFNECGNGLPLIRIRDLKTFSPQFYTEEVLPNTEYINIGDIVAGMDAEFMPYIWKGKKGVLNQRVCKFVPKYDYVSNFYIMNIVEPELKFVQSYKVGTTVSHLGKSDIDRFTVIIPPKEIVEKYSIIADAFLAEIIKVAKENFELSSLRDTLLPKLMNGEINI